MFDAKERQHMGELYGTPPKPTRDEYRAKLRKWCELADKRHTPAELAVIEADQARRVADMQLAERGGKRYDFFAVNSP